jgi:L-rhamnose mutarotase
MRRIAFLVLCALSGLTAGCTASGRAPVRYGMVIDVRPEQLAYYKQLHAEPWPRVVAQLAESNIHNYSIYLVERRQGEFTLFGYFEYDGDDFAADMARMAADPTVQRWWQETGPCQQAIPMAQGRDGIGATDWFVMEEIFHAK